MSWQTVEEFPNYIISKEGVVKNEDTGHVRALSRTQSGAVKVTLFKHGVGYTRSLALLVAKAHLYNDHDPEIFDTPIHLDNDQLNNHVDNLAWRPRWFAVKYQKQYWNPEFRHAKTRVEDVALGDVYDSLVEPCQRYGLLYVDVIKSCTQGSTVFPTWKIFRFV